MFLPQDKNQVILFLFIMLTSPLVIQTMERPITRQDGIPSHDADKVNEPCDTDLNDSGNDLQLKRMQDAIDRSEATFRRAHEAIDEAKTLVEDSRRIQRQYQQTSSPSLARNPSSNSPQAKANANAKVQFLLEKQTDVNACDIHLLTPLHKASRQGDTEAVRLLISRGADVNAQDANGNSALHDAAWHGHCDIVRVLLENGANIDAVDNGLHSAFYWANLNNKAEIIKLLIMFGAKDITIDDINLIFKDQLFVLAAALNDVPLIQALITSQTSSAELNEALMIAIGHGNHQVVSILLHPLVEKAGTTTLQAALTLAQKRQARQDLSAEKRPEYLKIITLLQLPEKLSSITSPEADSPLFFRLLPVDFAKNCLLVGT